MQGLLVSHSAINSDCVLVGRLAKLQGRPQPIVHDRSEVIGHQGGGEILSVMATEALCGMMEKNDGGHFLGVMERTVWTVYHSNTT